MDEELSAKVTQCHAGGTLSLSASAIAIGAFDGVHKGHQMLINRMVVSAQQLGVPSVVYTFDPPPKVFFGAAVPLISLDEKVDRIAALRPDHIVVVHFDDAYRRRQAEEFLAEIGALNPEIVWVGGDFRFGACKKGDADMLGSYFNTMVLEQQCCERGEPISSTRIRELAATGRRQAADRLQGWGRFDFAGSRFAAHKGGAVHG